jgi:hypothetical protein
MSTRQDAGGCLTAYVTWVHRLDWPLMVFSIALFFASPRLGSYVMLCVALALLVGGSILVFDLGDSARQAISRHRFLRPWGQESIVAWRVWGAGMAIEAAFLVTVCIVGGHLAG